MQRSVTTTLVATGGLGVSEFVYRMFTLFVSVRFAHFVYRMIALWPHGKKQCPSKSVYILLFALQLLFSRFVSFRAITSFFSPTHPCLYIFVSLQVCIE